MVKEIKVIFKDELMKLHILKLLEMQNGILNISKPVDLDQLASRLSCDPGLLLETLLEMGVGVIEDS